jgi:hypothetical protein
MSPTKIRSRVACGVVALGILSACEGKSTSRSSERAQAVLPQSRAAMITDQTRSSRELSLATTGASARAEAPPQPPAQQSAAEGMIIRNGQVSIEVDSVEVAIDRIRQLTASLGGQLGNVTLNTGERQVRSASLEMKVPSARFDDALTGVAPLGKLEHSTSTAQDVGEEFVDVSARIANAKRLENRLLVLLSARTGKLEDVLAVERELARVREEIERTEGRLRFLRDRVATSTVVAFVHEKAPLVAASPGTNVIGQAFLNMWRNFVGFVALAIEALGVVIPIALIAWLLARRWRRWRAHRIATA